MTKYCEGLDCAICNQKEPCIYKIANELQEENEELRQVRKDNPDIQQPYVILYRQLKKENNELNHIVCGYHICFEGAVGAMEHLLKTKKYDDVEYYTQVAKNYLDYRKDERNKAKEVYDKHFEKLKQKNEKLKKQLAVKHLDFEIEYNRKTEEKEHRVYLEQKLEKIKEMLQVNIEQTNVLPLKNNLIKILQITEGEDGEKI